MKMNIKLGALILISGIIYLAGCTKPGTNTNTSATLVGTWTRSTDREQTKVSNTTTYDTTIAVAAGTYNVTYTSGGRYSYVVPGRSGGGTYVFNGSTIFTIDTTFSNTQNSVNVTSLAANSFVIQIADTTTTSPFTVQYSIYTYTR